MKDNEKGIFSVGFLRKRKERFMYVFHGRWKWPETTTSELHLTQKTWLAITV